MSLAMTAAPIDNQYSDNNDNIINKKRQHNRTQKRLYNIDSQKVNSVIESLHSSEQESGTSYKPLVDFELADYKPLNPLAPPIVHSKQEGMSNLEKTMNNSVSVPQPIENDNSALKSLENAFMNDDEVRRYYGRLVANYNQETNNNTHNIHPNIHSNIHPNNMINNTNMDGNQILIDKLNYMINLLEEKQDERTNNVTEEVVLYSFLGIFIIFVVDSFVRVGKYVR
jgi:hypothetical protein